MKLAAAERAAGRHRLLPARRVMLWALAMAAAFAVAMTVGVTMTGT